VLFLQNNKMLISIVNNSLTTIIILLDMFKKISLFLLLSASVSLLTKAQDLPVAHQITPSCYVATNGKIIVDAGGQYTTAVSAQVFLRDSLYGSTFDTVSSNFKNNRRINYTYDAGGLLTESSSKTVDKSGLTWSLSQQIKYQYTGFQLFEETFRSWDKTLLDWVNLVQNKYTYETDNSLSSIFHLQWKGSSSIWDYSTKDLINYDVNKNIISLENQKWNDNLNKWDNYLRINFSYSGGFISEKLYQVWNKSTQLWDDYQKENFTYTNSKKSEVVMQVKSASTNWENYSRYVYTYNGSSISEITDYFWFGSWTGNRKLTYTFNSNSLETLVVTQQWAAHLGNFRNISQDESYYTQREVFGIDEAVANTFIVSNPLSKSIPFQLNGLQERTNYEMSLISLNGSVVMNIPLTAGQTVGLNNRIPNGIYMLSITTAGNKVMSQKILITD